MLAGSFCKPILGVEEADRARALGEEDVGGRPVAFLVDEQREVGGVAVADVDADAGLVGELLEEREDQLLLATRVDGEPVTATGGGATRETAADDCCADQQGEAPTHHLPSVARPVGACKVRLTKLR